MKKYLFLLTLICFIITSYAQEEPAVYPTHWWVGMKNPKLQLMIHAKDIASMIPQFKLPASGIKIANGFTLTALHRVENPNYMFIDLVVDKNAKPGVYDLKFIVPGSNV